MQPADTPPTALRGFLALVALSARRHWRTRSLGLVTFALLALTATAVGVLTHGPQAWWLERRSVWVNDLKPADANGRSPVVRMTYRDYSDERLTIFQMFPGPPEAFGVRSLAFAPLRAMIRDEKYLADYAFLSYSRWVIFGLYLGFLLPLFTLAYATGSVGGEREDRTLVWLVTRPLPRGLIYLGKFAGVLPWCVAVSLAGFALLCAAGGPLGQRAFVTYWPAVLCGSVGFAALFHLVGAVVRRPAVVGLVYVFFFETLVNNLPGSLKRLSLNYYCRSLLYNEAAREAPAAAVPDVLDVYEPVSATTAMAVLLIAAAALTLLGMWLFSRMETSAED